MIQSFDEISFSVLIGAQNYTIDSLESEIRADRFCSHLLKHFHRWLLDIQQFAPLEAGQLAAGADYFLREFLIGARRQNIFGISAEQLRQFGGNWYIISNLEPNNAELKPMLRGATLFYRYATELNLFSAEEATAVDKVAQQNAFFSARIEDFHQLQDDEYRAWDQACPLK